MGFFDVIPQSERLILDLVTFEEILINYNKNYNLYVNFTLDPQLRGSTLDWIGIFQAGWEKYESFLTYEWGIGDPTDNTGRKRRIIFDSHYLKSAKPNTSYQFVYISRNLEILGVSQFFQFIQTEDQNDSLCLNASFVQVNLHNSTEHNINRDEYMEIVKENISPVKRPRPTCSINVPNNWEQAYTSCWRCKSLFEMKNKHNELNAMLKSYNEQNEELKERLNKLETALENVWIPKNIKDSWDENQERMKYKHFVSVVTGTGADEGYEKGDHLAEKNALVKSENLTPSFDCLNDASSKELLYKAIIGSQEDKIRELTRTVVQLQNIILPRVPRSVTSTDIITLVKTKEKMIPEIVDLENSDEDVQKEPKIEDSHMPVEKIVEENAVCEATSSSAIQ